MVTSFLYIVVHPLEQQHYSPNCVQYTMIVSHGVDFADVLMLMSLGLETEPQSNVSILEDDTLTSSIKSQADSLSGSTSGLERSESSLSLASKLRRNSSSGHFSARCPVLSPRSEGQLGPANAPNLEQESSGCTGMEAETSVSGSSCCLIVFAVVFLRLGYAFVHAVVHTV